MDEQMRKLVEDGEMSEEAYRQLGETLVKGYRSPEPDEDESDEEASNHVQAPPRAHESMRETFRSVFAEAGLTGEALEARVEERMCDPGPFDMLAGEQ